MRPTLTMTCLNETCSIDGKKKIPGKERGERCSGSITESIHRVYEDIAVVL